MAEHEVQVSGLPAWMDVRRLLGPGAWAFDAAGTRLAARATLATEAAADVAARLRGIGLDGELLQVQVDPPIKRSATREARTQDAKRRRSTSTGFHRAGTRVDEQGLISLTPEAVANKIAASNPGLPVIDAGCGVGGNTIAFARADARVIAIEREAGRLALARHNARVYEVERAIQWRSEDAINYIDMPSHAPIVQESLVFVDPPWGADYDRGGTHAKDFPLLEALLERRERFAALWAKLPPSFAAHEHPEAIPQAYFGEAAGDRRRVKFVLLRW